MTTRLTERKVTSCTRCGKSVIALRNTTTGGTRSCSKSWLALQGV